jgi:hypothetical protein
VSGSSVFTGGNAERSTVEIDLSCSFLIVRLRSVKMHSTIVNTHDTAVNYYSKFTVL